MTCWKKRNVDLEIHIWGLKEPPLGLKWGSLKTVDPFQSYVDLHSDLARQRKFVLIFHDFFLFAGKPKFIDHGERAFFAKLATQQQHSSKQDAKGYSLSKLWSSAVECCAQKLYIFHFPKKISFLQTWSKEM